MKQYYFFKVCRGFNASRQFRTVLHPLPNQFTFKTLRDRHHPIDPACKVQLCNAQNHIAVQLPSLTIIGVCHEGVTERECSIREYTRDNAIFYRTDAEIRLILSPTGDPLNCIPLADEEMLQAYRELVSRDATPQEAAAPTTENVCPSHVAPVQMAPEHVAEPITFDPNEMRQIEESLMCEMSEREALGKLLIISQIRDRMKLGVVKFSYEKQNGDIRIAYGTRNREAMQCVEYAGSGNAQQRREGDGAHFNYFDIQKRDWRCFCTRDIRSVEVGQIYTDPNSIIVIAAQAV